MLHIFPSDIEKTGTPALKKQLLVIVVLYLLTIDVRQEEK
jgi:hypothetical protein